MRVQGNKVSGSEIRTLEAAVAPNGVQIKGWAGEERMLLPDSQPFSEVVGVGESLEPTPGNMRGAGDKPRRPARQHPEPGMLKSREQMV